MNCPYCNNKCAVGPETAKTNILGEYICYNCDGYPEFVEWNENVANRFDKRAQGMFFEVFFFSGTEQSTIYYPNHNTLIVLSLSKRFNISYAVTSDNIVQTLERILNMKAFL